MKFLVVVLVLVLGVQVYGAGPDESCDEASARYVPGVSRQSKLHIWMYGPDKSSTTNSDIATNQDVPSSTDRKDFSERYRQNPDFYGTQVDVQSHSRTSHGHPEQNPKPKGTGRRQRSPQARARRRQRKLIALQRGYALAPLVDVEKRLNEELLVAKRDGNYAKAVKLQISLQQIAADKARVMEVFAPPPPLGAMNNHSHLKLPQNSCGVQNYSGIQMSYPCDPVLAASPTARGLQLSHGQHIQNLPIKQQEAGYGTHALHAAGQLQPQLINNTAQYEIEYIPPMVLKAHEEYNKRNKIYSPYGA